MPEYYLVYKTSRKQLRKTAKPPPTVTDSDTQCHTLTPVCTDSQTSTATDKVSCTLTSLHLSRLSARHPLYCTAKPTFQESPTVCEHVCACIYIYACVRAWACMCLYECDLFFFPQEVFKANNKTLFPQIWVTPLCTHHVA